MSASEPSFGPTVPFKTLLPVFAPASSEVLDWVAPMDSAADKHIKLQPLHGPGGQLIGYVHQTYKPQYGEHLWPNAKGKCEQNFEAVKTHRRRREDYMYADPVEHIPTLKPIAVEATVAALQQMVTHTLEKLIAHEHNCGKTLKQHSSELRHLLERIGMLERALDDHRTVIYRLQKRLNMHSIHAVSSSPVIPKAKRRKIKPHGHRQENND